MLDFKSFFVIAKYPRNRSTGKSQVNSQGKVMYVG